MAAAEYFTLDMEEEWDEMAEMEKELQFYEDIVEDTYDDYNDEDEY